MSPTNNRQSSPAREAPDSNSLSPSLSPGQALDKVALIANNFGDGHVFRDVLGDWYAFMGGRPGQVVIVDNGSAKETQAAIYDAYCEGMIDKLVLVQPGHCDTGNHQVFIAEHTSPAIATKPYLLWFHIDTLPFRQGHEDWLSEAISYLDRDDVFAVGGSFNIESKHHDAWPGWYFSHKCSENFALMKRSEFVRVMEEFCGEYISSGFTGKNPAAVTGQNRYLLEVAFERYIQAHQKFTLVREEDPTWTIFHTNVHGERLGKVRRDYLARKRVTNFLNAGCTGAKPPGIYYGQPPVAAWLRRVRTRFGRSPMGPYWRAIKDALAQGMK
jgi:hypothetical protein